MYLMPNRILVLLSTYNGEKYLPEQLASIIHQKNASVHLLIRDDGSSDKTVNLIEATAAAHPGKITWVKGNRNMGAAQSFRQLMSEARAFDYDFLAFCDQDDIWDEHKLEIATRRLSEFGDEKPNLFFSSYQKIDQDGKPLPTSVHPLKLSLGEALVMNPSMGCTQVFNKALLDKALKTDFPDKVLHDWWVYALCLALHGNVCYEPAPLVMYRQHDKNVLGGKTLSKRQKFMNWLFHKNNNLNLGLAQQIYGSYREELEREDMKLLSMVVNYKRSFFSKLRLLAAYKKFSTFVPDVNKGFLLSVFCGKF